MRDGQGLSDSMRRKHRLVRRHLYSLIFGGCVFALIPSALRWLGASDQSVAKLHSLPFLRNSFQLAGGLLVMSCVHLLLVLGRADPKEGGVVRHSGKDDSNPYAP